MDGLTATALHQRTTAEVAAGKAAARECGRAGADAPQSLADMMSWPSLHMRVIFRNAARKRTFLQNFNTGLRCSTYYSGLGTAEAVLQDLVQNLQSLCLCPPVCLFVPGQFANQHTGTNHEFYV